MIVFKLFSFIHRLEFMNKICVFGANGQTGQEILRQALDLQIPIRAAVRNRDSLPIYKNKIEICEYSFHDPLSIEAAIAGCEIVICTIGSGSLSKAMKPINVYSNAARSISEAMKRLEVHRLIMISSGGVEYDAKAPWYYRYLLRPMLINTYMDMMKMETIIEEQNDTIHWTIVRPTYLSDGPSKDYLVKNRKVEEGNFKIFRVDLATFIVNESQQHNWVHMYPTLGYK